MSIFKRFTSSVVTSAGLAALLYGGSASANLIEYSFTGADGEHRTVPAATPYANPKGKVNFALSAGLERRVRISILSDTGELLDTQTSHVLRASDRITAAGREYYGAVLELTAPPEGNYTLKSEILSSTGDQVSSASQEVQIDTTPPAVGPAVFRSGGHTMEVLHFNGYSESGRGDLYVLDVSDAGGLANAEFFAIDNGGEGEKRVTAASLQDSQGRVSVVLNSSLRSVMPHERHHYLIGFDVYDKAGNKSTVSQATSLDNEVPYIGMEVFNPVENLWVPFVANMLAYENPVKMRFVRRKEDHINHNGTKFGWIDSYNYADDEFLYNTANVPVPAPNSSRTFKTFSNGSIGLNYRNYRVQLAPGIEEAPMPLKVETHIKYDSVRSNGSVLQAGWHAGSQFNVSAPVHADKVRVHAEKRTYPQRVFMGSVYQDCVIQPGEDYCDMINDSYEIVSGKGYSPLQIRLLRHDTGTLTVAYTHLYRYWDFNAPEIQEVNVDTENSSLYMRVLDADRTNTWTSYMWDTKILNAFAVDTKTGKETQLTRTSYEDISYNTKEASYQFNGLPDGQYRFRFEAVDTYQNKTEHLTEVFAIDNTPPTLKITSGAEISSLDEISILVSDGLDSSPRVTSINLKGGPATDDVWLSAREESPGKFKLEYPIMFPSLEAGEEYTLVVTASDNQANTVTSSLSFTYSPPVTILPGDADGRIRIPAVPAVFTDRQGRHVVSSDPILLSDGTAISGVYEMFATLRTDAPGSLYINETLVRPGDTVQINEMSFTETGGRVILPVRSGELGAAGDHNLMITSTAPNFPTLLATITSWVPEVSLVVKDQNPIQVMSEQSISINVRGASFCPVTTNATLARDSDPLNAPVCLLEWDSKPRGLKEVPVDGSDRLITKLEGRYLQSGPQTVGYKIYVFGASGSKHLIHEATQTVEVEKIERTASFVHSLEFDTIQRAVETAKVTMAQVSEPSCMATTNTSVARNNSISGGPLTCLFEFTAVPDDLKQTSVSPPEFSGVFSTAGEHEFGWVASVFDEEGNKLVMDEKTTTITVVHPPVTTSLDLSVNESSFISVSSTESHPKAWASKAYSIITQAAMGVVEVTPSGFKYTPQAGYVGQDSFVYRVTDATGMYAEATAKVNVLEFNYPPAIENVAFTSSRNEVSFFELNAEDPNLWDSHTFRIVSPPKPAGVTATIQGGQIEFNPVAHWYGTTTLSYQATDSKGLKSEIATITVNIPLGGDSSAPLVNLTSETACLAPSSIPEFDFTIEDFDSGVDANSLSLQARFSDMTVDVPFRLMNRSEVEVDRTLQVAPRRYNIKADIKPGTALETRLRTAYYDVERYGGRLPFDLVLSVSDTVGNEANEVLTLQPRVIGDTQAPALDVSVGDGSILRHLNDLSVVVTDDLSGIHSEEIIATLSYRGQAVPLIFNQAFSASAPSRDMCFSRHPLRVEYRSHQSNLVEEEALALLSKAYIAGEQVKLEVTAADYAGNERKKTVMFEFSPEPFVADTVKVPAVSHQFRDDHGNPTVKINAVDAVMSFDSSVAYMAVASLENGAPIAINGKPLLSGQPINLGHFSLLEGEHLPLDIRSDQTGVSGAASVLLVPLNPTARAIQIPVLVWEPEIKLTAKTWEPVQLFEQVNVRAAQTDAAACRLTSNADAARYSDKIGNPLCLFQWDILPADTFSLAQDYPEMAGLISQTGRHLLAWSVLLVDEAGGSHVMKQGEEMFDVRSATEVLRFDIDTNPGEPYRVISEVTGSLKQGSGPSCSVITTSEELAHDMSARNMPGCLISWEGMPQGIEPQQWSDEAKFQGVFDIAEGDALFEWSVSSFSPSGVMVDIGTYEHVVELKDPPSPHIDIASSKLIAGSLYRAPVSGGLVGAYTVEALNSPVQVEVTEGGQLINSDEATGGFSQRLVYHSRILVGEKELWARTPVEIDARYSSFPSVNSQKGIEILSVPDEDLRPDLSLKDGVVLNTDGMTVETWIGHPYKSDVAYSSETMGQWELRLLNYRSTKIQEPLTDFAKIDADGKVVFDIDLLDLGTDFMRVMPEAKLLSPLPEYERTVMGARPLHITILRGESIDSSLNARKVKGEAPLRFMSKLDLENRLDYKALGDVIWELRKEGDSEWVETESTSSITDRFQYVFETGKYELRARVFNKNSEAEFVTEQIEIHAYNVPRISIEGPSNAFIGSGAKLALEATVDGHDVDPKDLIVEWSEDNGDSWVNGGVEYVVKRDEEERVMMMTRVRMSDSPEDWLDANVTRRHRVAFRSVSPPRGSILGSRVIEEGEPVVWRGSARAPYPRMDVEIQGHFILPDGTVVDESEVEYLPTRADTERDRSEVQYVSWIVGYEDQGARSTVSRRVSIWQYKWPNWSMNVRASANQAPAEVNLRVRKPVGMGRYLEEVKYEWELPAGVELVASRTDENKVIQIDKPGIYPVIVRISDARGNFTELTEEIVIQETEAWDVDFRMSMSNADNRAPLSVRLSPSVRGGHPRDRVDIYRYLLNGQTISEGARYSSVDLAAGTHEVALEITSDFGEVARSSHTIEVQENTPPVCELEAVESRSHWRFFATCTDETGKVRRHIWKLNGEQLTLSGSRISVGNREGGVIEIQLSAIDDGGAESNVVTWHGSAAAEDEDNTE